MVELVIRGGRIVDGTGAPAQVGDVAIDKGRIVAVGEVTERGAREIQADGLVVAPGWVDIHTHYDGQVTWDPIVAPSSINGVTSIVMGNCGVGFAPARPGEDAHEFLISLLEGVEDIPGTALAEGLPWDWESFPQYLDAVERRPHTIDMGTYVPHASLRAYVMGQRGADHTAVPTDDELAEMARLTREALDAGAVGFATSRTYVHRTRAGANIGTFGVAERELAAIVSALRDAGRGVMQMISDAYLTGDQDMVDGELAMMESLVAYTGRPLAMTVQQPEDVAHRWREMLDFVARANAAGHVMRAQVAPRPIGLLHGLQCSINPFLMTGGYREIAHLPVAERARAMADPERRRRILAEHAGISGGVGGDIAHGFHKLFPLAEPANYEPDPSTALGAEAARLGVPAPELAYDRLIADDGAALFYMPLHNYASGNLDDVREMLSSDHTLVALSDAGAHCGLICDGTFPTTLVSHWTRRTRGEGLPLEFLVHKQTQRNARWIGWRDRGVVAPGYLADLNVIDLDGLFLHAPHLVHDLPAGGKRLMQEAEGYRYTIKTGAVTFEDGQHTGALPGTVVRGDQPAPV